MKFLSRLNRPWLHFIVLGSLLFYLQGVLFPEPKPVIGPLGEARLEALQQQWFASTGRLPKDEQMARMVAAELDRDMLFQRAIELEQHILFNWKDRYEELNVADASDQCVTVTLPTLAKKVCEYVQGAPDAIARPFSGHLDQAESGDFYHGGFCPILLQDLFEFGQYVVTVFRSIHVD